MGHKVGEKTMLKYSSNTTMNIGIGMNIMELVDIVVYIIYLDNIHKRGNVVVSFVTDGSVTGRGFLLYYKLYSKRGASK